MIAAEFLHQLNFELVFVHSFILARLLYKCLIIAFDALHQAFIYLMAEAEAHVNQLGNESDYSSSESNSLDTDTSSSDDEELPTATQCHH